MRATEAIAVVIPCLNEAETIGPLVTAARRWIPKVIVVDDGSTDGTASLALKAGAEVLVQPVTSGKGSALRAGWNRAQELGFDWALCMDGDGQHAPEDIPVFLQSNEAVPLVIGNRMGDTAAMPHLRRWVNRWMSRQISRRLHRVLPDTQCGFRLMHLPALRRLDVTASHFEIESDMLAGFVRANLPVQFVPVQTLYRSRKSRIHPLRDTVRWFRWWRSLASPGVNLPQSPQTAVPPRRAVTG